MNDKTDEASQTSGKPKSVVTPAGQGDGMAQPATGPAQPVDQASQEEAGRDRAEGGGYT